jgi:hypothetical protein
MVTLPLLVLSAVLYQDTIRISPREACPRCTIEFERIIEFGSVNDPTSPDEYSFSFAFDSSGRLYAAPMADKTTVGVYDRSGRFVSTIGRAGAGPGEYRVISEVKMMRGDTLLVSDIAAARITLIDAEHRVAASFNTISGVRGVLPLRDGTFVVHANTGTRDKAGMSLHRINRAGDVMNSFGESAEPYDARQVAPNVRIIAQGAGGTIWSARQNRYLIEEWTSDGALRRVLSANPPWFEAWTVPARVPSQRPNTRLRLVFQDAEGLLWVISQAPDRRWRPESTGAPAGQETHETRARPTAEWAGFVDSIVDVIDPRSGQLIVRRRYDEVFGADMSGGHGYVGTQRQLSTGVTRVTVWRPKLVRR